MLGIWIFFALGTFVFAQQNDPLKQFCRLHSHQTTVVDRKLYIDGGLVNWAPFSADSINYTSTWLRNAHLDEDNQGFPQESLLAKNESVPSVHGGILWPDTANKIVYQYGGEYGNDKPEQFRLWYYDIVYNTWNMSNATTTDVRRASWGAGATAQDRGMGYYYGGWLTNGSVPGYQPRTPLKSLLIYDIANNIFRNESGYDDTPRAEGAMVYLPIGDGGFMVYFGGIQFPYGNSTATAFPMDEILLYDVVNTKWYKQTASGSEIPENRRRFCAGATWAEDRSSYNIYLFGGAAVGDGVGYGDVWVLSLPSFTWIKFWPRKEDGVGATFPKHSTTCDVIENSQMIIQGGTTPNQTTDCDVAVIYGQHGLDLGKANSQNVKWASFNPNVTKYQVPTEIAKSIGGGATGGATVLAPTSGWEERDVQTQFQRHYTPTTRLPTRQIPTATTTASSKKSNKKTIIASAVGGGVGGLLLLAALVAGTCLCLRRRRRGREEKNEGPQQPYVAQTMTDAVTAHPGSFLSPSGTQYSHSPHGSPQPPSDRELSQYGLVTPEQPRSPAQFDNNGRLVSHSRLPSEQSFTRSWQSSPTAYHEPSPRSDIFPVQEMPNVRPTPFQEMPNVRSPLGVASSQLSPNFTGIEPYFAQHPPRGAGKE